MEMRSEFTVTFTSKSSFHGKCKRPELMTDDARYCPEDEEAELSLIGVCIGTGPCSTSGSARDVILAIGGVGAG